MNEYKIRVEANEELIDTLHEHEMSDSARFDEMQRYWEDQRKDPDDVFIDARNRKQQIREQIRELQKGLGRQKPRIKKKD